LRALVFMHLVRAPPWCPPAPLSRDPCERCVPLHPSYNASRDDNSTTTATGWTGGNRQVWFPADHFSHHQGCLTSPEEDSAPHLLSMDSSWSPSGADNVPTTDRRWPAEAGDRQASDYQLVRVCDAGGQPCIGNMADDLVPVAAIPDIDVGDVGKPDRGIGTRRQAHGGDRRSRRRT
jgi:hypothetical protein